MTVARLLFAAFLLVLAVGPLAAADALPPTPKPHYVLDRAGWLNGSEFRALDAKLEQFERDTSSQVLVAIFPKLPDGAELFDFSQRLYDAWKPGQAGKDNGAILLIFDADRKMRIQVGYGLEGALPDARSRQIIGDQVAPLLRENRRAAAVNAGVDAMIAAAKGEYKGTGRTRLDRDGKPADSPGFIIFLFLCLVIFGPIVRRLLGGDRVYSDRGVGRGPWMGGGGGWGGGGGFGGGGGGGGGFSGGGGRSGGGGASGGW